jgi:AcrR family transcriptional regulator
MFVKRRRSQEEARRVPTQARSLARRGRILDAAARVFAEAGFDAATTEAIAERAETSIGSVYQFFPNKEALFDAVAAGYLEGTEAMFDQLVTAEGASLSWEELIDRVIDGFVDFDRKDPYFRAVLVSWPRSAAMMTAGQALNREFARRGEAILGARAKGLPKAKRALVATVLVETISAMCLVAVRSKEEAARQVVAETKLMLRRYLAPYMKRRE